MRPIFEGFCYSNARNREGWSALFWFSSSGRSRWFPIVQQVLLNRYQVAIFPVLSDICAIFAIFPCFDKYLCLRILPTFFVAPFCARWFQCCYCNCLDCGGKSEFDLIYCTLKQRNNLILFSTTALYFEHFDNRSRNYQRTAIPLCPSDSVRKFSAAPL